MRLEIYISFVLFMHVSIRRESYCIDWCLVPNHEMPAAPQNRYVGCM
jgi:hypothetical protein